MARVALLHESGLSAADVERILAHWSTLEDTCRDEPIPLTLTWPCEPKECKDVFDHSMVVTKRRDLPDYIAAEAREYIAVLVARYPFQLRPEMARPMWHRFLDVWNDTSSRRLALRAI